MDKSHGHLLLARWIYFCKFFCYRDYKTFWFSIFVIFPISAYWMVTNFTAFIFIYVFFVFLVLLCSPCWPRIYWLVCWPSLKLQHSSRICLLIAGFRNICHQVFRVTHYLSNSLLFVLLHVCLCPVYVWCSWKSEEGVRSHWTRVPNGCETPCGCWGWTWTLHQSKCS